MPSLPPRLRGIVLLLVAATVACASPVPSLPPADPIAAAPVASPMIAGGSANAPWTLDLTFAGDLAGHVTGTDLSGLRDRNECTGPQSARSGSWASTMLMAVGQERVSMVVLVPGYKGAGSFASGVTVELHSRDLARVWQTRAGDPAAFTVAPAETSGTVDAVLSNAAVAAQKVHVTGRWTCG
ncbi:MAG: hypothetical protein NVS9B1_09140 [Candidatus Dormibacteraceae bacterium]